MGLQITISIVVVAFIAHSAIEALHDAVGLRMPRFGFYVDQVVCLDERGDIAIDELAAVIVHDPGFGILTRFERRLQLNGNRFVIKTHQQLVVHDIAAIRIDKAEQKVEASGNRLPGFEFL
ncbi:MAG: hypothetical protein ABI612_03655 [Betaproteobacteria bacterium]